MYKQQGRAGEDRGNGQTKLISSTTIPLRCLLLRGNNLTDAGALALVPLVEASGSLAAIDLRGNRIGTKGELALKKVMACRVKGGALTNLRRRPEHQSCSKNLGIRVIAAYLTVDSIDVVEARDFIMRPAVRGMETLPRERASGQTGSTDLKHNARMFFCYWYHHINSFHYWWMFLQALTRSPWVHRVTSEEVSGSDAREGPISTGGVILRAKRRPMYTVRDRARVHAFKKIPPSGQTFPGKATLSPGPCSASGDRPEEYHAGNDDGGRAPAPGSSIGCRHDEYYDGQGACRRSCEINLTPTDLERPINMPVAASPMCTIDLRGCSRRPLPLPLAAVGESEQGELLPPPTPTPTRVEGPPPKQRRHDCGGVGLGTVRHQVGDPETCVNQNTFSEPGRVDAASTSRGHDGHVTRLMRTGLAANVMGSSSRRPRYNRRRKPAPRGEDCLYAPKSEAQELEDLTSLLSISRRIFSRTNGFEETHNLLEERRTQGATRAQTSPTSGDGKRPDSIGTEPDTSKPGLPRKVLVTGLGRSHSTSAPEENSQETDKYGQVPSSAGKGDTTASTKVARAERPQEGHKTSDVGVGKEAIDGEGYPADNAATSGQAPPASIRASHLGDIQCDDRTPLLPPTAEPYPHEESRVVISGNPFPAEDCDAIACRSTDDPPDGPACSSPPRAYPAICADERQTTTTTTASGSHHLEGAEKPAVVDDAATAGDIQYSNYQNGEDGWAYDEATSAWYAVDPLSYGTNGEGLGDNGGGWRYDEQTEAWYQDGPEDTSCVPVSTPTHVDTENTLEKDNGATGEEDRSDSRRRGSRRIPIALGSGDREKVRSTNREDRALDR